MIQDLLSLDSYVPWIGNTHVSHLHGISSELHQRCKGKQVTELKRRVKAVWKPFTYIAIVSYSFKSLSLMGGSLFVSRLLETALEGKWKDGIVVSAFGVIYALVVFSMDYLITKARNRADIVSKDRWRGVFSEMVVADNLSCETSGAYDGRAENDTWYMGKWYGEAYPSIIGCSISISISFFIILYRDWMLSLVVMAISSVSFIPKLVYEKWAKKNYEEEQSVTEAYTDWMEEGVNGAGTIKAYGVESWFIERFRKSNQLVLKCGVKVEGTSTVEFIVSEFVNSVFSWGMYLVIGAFALCGRLDVLTIPLMVVMSTTALSSFYQLTDYLIYGFLSDEAIERLGKWKDKRDEIASGEMDASLKDVRKSFDGVEILHGISIDFPKGSRTRLVGENGSGKTTLMRILIGIIEPDSGTVERAVRDIAFSFQEDPEIPVTAGNLVSKVLLTGKCDEKELRRLLSLFHMNDLMDQKIGDMSEGERKKLYVALTLSRKSDFLILDEPTNHVDAESVEVLVNELKGRRETILVCTHDERLEDVGFDRTLLLEEGVLHAR